LTSTTSDERRLLAGLATDRMIEAWEQFKREPVRYGMVEHNCSTMLAGLLEIGSGVKPSFVSSVPIDDEIAERTKSR
jgi:hypothetical protein